LRIRSLSLRSREEKTDGPPMNADKESFAYPRLSAFIGGHLIFSRLNSKKA
jgi:hypothetical protein